MLFNSHAFLFFFLPLALAGHLACPPRWRSAWLAACSYFFYGWWDWRYCGLLLLVTSIDYFAGARVAAAVNRVPPTTAKPHFRLSFFVLYASPRKA